MLFDRMDPGAPIKCKNCGAMTKKTLGGATTVECDYCHARFQVANPSAAAVLEALRSKAQQRSGIGLKFGIGLLVVIVAVGVIGSTLGGKSRSSTTTTSARGEPEREPAVAPAPPPAPPPPPPIGKVVLTFGEKGTNAGQLTGARAFAVMPSGEIVIAEVETGRVQVFDAKGVYQRVIAVPPSALTKELSMYGVGADDKGHAIVSRAGDLVVIDVAAGKVAKVIRGSYPDRYYTADVAVTPDGTIYATTDRTGDLAIVKVTLDGKVRGTIEKTGRRFAVDGLGTLYLTREHDRAIEIRDAKGEIEAKFSQGNPARGALQHPDEIAIDGRGHLFVQESNRVTILDTSGKFLGELDTGPVADLAVDREGYLYVLDREKVTKYELALPR